MRSLNPRLCLCQAITMGFHHLQQVLQCSINANCDEATHLWRALEFDELTVL